MFYLRLLVWYFFLIALPIILLAQENDSLRSEKIKILPQGQLFKPLTLDPTECQTSGTLATSWINNQYFDGLYILTAIGFSKGLLRWQKNATKYEIRFEAAAFSQFEIENKRRLLGNLINTDYKASIPFVIDKGKNQYRFRLFHNSSHLGDDFLITRQINNYLRNKMNFEQIDFTHNYQKKYWRHYYGLGFVVTPNANRQRLSLQAGTYYQKTINQAQNLHWFAGIDVKSFQETNFYPNTKLGAGLCIGNINQNPAYLLVEFYNGHFAYSLFEKDQIRWLGLSMYWQVN